MVGLSTWYKRDNDNVRLKIRTAEDQARVWLETLRIIGSAGLLDSLLYVDLCNEFPNVKWAPYLYASTETVAEPLTSDRLRAWMRNSIGILKQHYPNLDYTFSQSSFALWDKQDVTMLISSSRTSGSPIRRSAASMPTSATRSGCANSDARHQSAALLLRPQG